LQTLISQGVERARDWRGIAVGKKFLNSINGEGRVQSTGQRLDEKGKVTSGKKQTKGGKCHLFVGGGVRVGVHQ